MGMVGLLVTVTRESHMQLVEPFAVRLRQCGHRCPSVTVGISHLSVNDESHWGW